jgi:hypothetical protein
VSTVVAILLMLEGLASGIRLTRFVPILAIYSWSTAAFLAVRGAVGVLEFASGLMIVQRRRVGLTLGCASLLLSAALATAEIGFGLVPTSIFPTYRWPLVFGYWIYALIGVGILGSRSRKAGT